MVKYEGLGLDNVWLDNGYQWVETDHKRALAADNVEALERTMAQHVTEQSARLTGQAFRFLREMLNMSQGAFGKTFGQDYQTVARWEAALHTPVPKGADAMIRQLYLEGQGGRPLFTRIVEKLATANAAEAPAIVLHENADGTWRSGAIKAPKAALGRSQKTGGVWRFRRDRGAPVFRRPRQTAIQSTWNATQHSPPSERTRAS